MKERRISERDERKEAKRKREGEVEGGKYGERGDGEKERVRE